MGFVAGAVAGVSGELVAPVATGNGDLSGVAADVFAAVVIVDCRRGVIVFAGAAGIVVAPRSVVARGADLHGVDRTDSECARGNGALECGAVGGDVFLFVVSVGGGGIFVGIAALFSDVFHDIGDRRTAVVDCGTACFGQFTDRLDRELELESESAVDFAAGGAGAAAIEETRSMGFDSFHCDSTSDAFDFSRLLVAGNRGGRTGRDGNFIWAFEHSFPEMADHCRGRMYFVVRHPLRIAVGVFDLECGGLSSGGENCARYSGSTLARRRSNGFA